MHPNNLRCNRKFIGNLVLKLPLKQYLQHSPALFSLKNWVTRFTRGHWVARGHFVTTHQQLPS